jgi:FkbM family methyltransferase
MLLDPADTGLSRDLILFGTRERLQTALVKKWLKPSMTIVEVGANIGYYALMEASFIGENGKIYAIEPVEENYDFLKKNVFANHYENRIELYLLAISDADGIAQIAKTEESNLCTMLINNEELSEYGRKSMEKRLKEMAVVNTMTLDNFLEGKLAPDFIRMDVEGYETKIIKGMVKTLEDSKPGTKMFMEIHPALFKDSVRTVSEILAVLTKYGFKVEYIVDRTGNVFLDFTPENLIETISGDPAPGLFLVKS